MLKLYFCPGTSSMAPHIALYEIGAPFERKAISLARKENRTPEYLAINPEGKVPTLLVEGRALTEVAGILYYLAKANPKAGLWPEGGVEAEAQAISWMSFLAATVHPARAKGADAALAAWQIAEKRLAGHEWAVGNRYSIADIHLFRLYWRFSGALQQPPGTFPALEAHYARMMQRPAVKKTIEVESAIGYDLPR
jgi:glutathione S-transferase